MPRHPGTGRVERVTPQQGTAIHRVNHRVDTHAIQLRDLQWHVEDLDRGRRHNLCVRVLPESLDIDQLYPMVVGIFNNLLDRPLMTPIVIAITLPFQTQRVRDRPSTG